MSKTNEPTPPAKSNGLPASGDFKDMARASKGGLFSRIGDRFNEAIQQGRGGGPNPAPSPETYRSPASAVDDAASRRPRNASQRRMVIPEGITVEGSVRGSAESEIGGRVEGDITIDGPVFLLKSAVVTGNVRAVTCQLDGLVEGRVEVSNDLTIGRSGRLNADGLAGRNVDISGQVNGCVSTPGRLKMAEGCVVNGDVQARVLNMEEGAVLNGVCTMRAPEPKNDNNAPSKEQKTT